MWGLGALCFHFRSVGSGVLLFWFAFVRLVLCAVCVGVVSVVGDGFFVLGWFLGSVVAFTGLFVFRFMRWLGCFWLCRCFGASVVSFFSFRSAFCFLFC